MFEAFDLARGGGAGGFAFEVDSQIPVARGLGSSAAAVVAGLLLGDAIGQRRACPKELLAHGLALEGHPDNVAPSLLGGCRLSMPHESGAAVIEQTVHPSVGWAVSWPELAVSTQKARAVLPDATRETLDERLSTLRADVRDRLRALMPFCKDELAVADAELPRWDSDDGWLEDPTPDQGWPSDVDLRRSTRPPVYHLDRAAAGGLGLEGDLLLGWRGGDAIAAELA